MTYLEIAGHRVWHEVSGTGDPVVLLHGAFAGASSWGAQTPVLVDAGFTVYAPERRGHVHTPDIEGPLTYSVMADDTIAYLDAVVGPAHLVGWSDGAVVGLLVAERRPDLMRRLILIGQYYNFSGRVDGPVIDAITDPDSETVQFLRAEYDAESPDGPEHFAVVHAKTLRMIDTEPDIDLERLRAIEAQTLVLQGDRDEVTLEHGSTVAQLLPNGRFAVLPGSHGLPIESPDVVNPLLISFLRNGAPAQLF